MLPAQFGVACTAVKIFRLFMSTDCASVHKKMAQGIIVEILVNFFDEVAAAAAKESGYMFTFHRYM